jgi:DNA modification methylase
MQLDLFSHAASAYADAPNGRLSNADFYRAVADRAGIDPDELGRKAPVGRDGKQYLTLAHQLRWRQQDLKRMGVIERIANERGVWQLTESAGKKLDEAGKSVQLIAFSTKLGVAIFGNCKDVFAGIEDEIHLVFTSPPFLLAKPRAYGNPATWQEYVDFICAALGPVCLHMVPGASIVINLTNDSFVQGSPARSTYLERLVIALEDRLGLHLMDRLIWRSAKAPGPTQWACKHPIQLRTGYEFCLWFTNDPMRVRSNNRRVLLPHTERHIKLMTSGGIQHAASYGDGSQVHRPGQYGTVTEGRLPTNVIEIGTGCADTRAYRRRAQALGLPVHGAMMPTLLPEFFIEFLTEPGDLVVDMFGGTGKTALAAERLGRRWAMAEKMLQYIRGAATHFEEFDGFLMNPALEAVRYAA